MQPKGRRHPFFQGALDAAPFVIVLAPFGFLFGLVASEAGLNILQVLSFSILVLAGAAQLTAIQLLTEEAPTVIVIVSALAVNLRMGMYSAALAPHMGDAPLLRRAMAAYLLFDQPYALSSVAFEKHPDTPVVDKFQYFFGAGAPIAFLWYLTSLSGAVLGDKIPSNIGIDFALPITFLAVVAPMLKSSAHVASALTASIAALIFNFMPFGTGLLVAAFLALIVGATVEVWAEKRAART
ncbi:putative branched-subunit amino acid permease [Pacificibacter maritimus]|uniref:Putative branched-subunit amino acid permease n=1 Tax=Pacificibacter maritimus TaxID=762213 RepID=A0A3N4U645_9RHOB|nr:AzlC family ABC transporter permease [Pacificibacter maritimus]RPE66263.1 putative branched-subunit amino acid permease [Pacificibacter maritimus]